MARKRTRIVGHSVRRFGPGDEAVVGEYDPGDFILTHGKTIISQLIRFGQRVRFRGQRRKYAWWNHAAMIVSADGDLVEALGAGVERTNLFKYKGTEYHLVRLNLLATPHDRKQVVRFAEWCRGEEYGYVTVVSIALSLLTGAKFSFGFDGQQICSGLVARALERTDIIFDQSPSHVMPANLAEYFDIEPPPPGTDIGAIPD